MKSIETRERTIAKAVTFRLLASLITVILVAIFTGNVQLAGDIGLLDFIIKIITYYLHERTWDRIKWGVNCKKYS